MIDRTSGWFPRGNVIQSPFVVDQDLIRVGRPWAMANHAKAEGEVHAASWFKKLILMSCRLGLFDAHCRELPEDLAKLQETKVFPLEVWKNTVVSDEAKFWSLTWIV